jgi:transcriptional regulator with PAS, ATPase and Fis domain
VAVDCCTVHENLFESELFGHEKGAFTGATSQKKGLIEGAEGGTLFLDEFGEITLAAQAKMLRVLETGQFRRVGGTKNLVADARIVAATNRDLKKLSKEGVFREDLYYRLSAFTITVPPLRERREDIAALADHFLSNHDFSRRIMKSLAPDAERALVAHHWPGNVRELRNAIERAIIVSGQDAVIRAEHLGLPEIGQEDSETMHLQFDREPTMEELKRCYMEWLLTKYSGHRAQLAASLGISERNVYRLLKKFSLIDV